MKKLLLTFFLFFFCISTVTIFAKTPEIARQAKVETVKGTVELKRGKTSGWSKLSKENLVKSGDGIKTSKSANVILRWNNSNVISIGESSELEFTTLVSKPVENIDISKLDLKSGRILVSAKSIEGTASTFEITTPSAVLDVRGTVFGVETTEAGVTEFQCLEGELSVKSAEGSEVSIGPLEKTKVKQGAPPSAPEGLNDNDKNSFKEISKFSQKDFGDNSGTNKKEEKAVTEEAVAVPIPGRLVVNSPRDGFMTNEESIVVSGIFSPLGEISIQDEKVEMHKNGVFTKDIDLVEGANDIVVRAYDPEGNEAGTSKIRVTRDSIPPFLDTVNTLTSFGLMSNNCLVSEAGVRCIITGTTEPDATLSVDGKSYDINNDGSFSVEVTIPYDFIGISIAAKDPAGNITSKIVRRATDRSRVEYLDIAISPSSIVANKQDTAIITITALNLFREPVNQTLSISATSGGSLSSNTVTTVNGIGTVTFTAGAGSILSNTTITVTNGVISSSANIVLLPDTPPLPSE
ncbi:MAG TPA: FecR domain-containing protein [bacterium]|nr:FecR domain-containing protein [bacterium]